MFKHYCGLHMDGKKTCTVTLHAVISRGYVWTWFNFNLVLWDIRPVRILSKHDVVFSKNRNLKTCRPIVWWTRTSTYGDVFYTRNRFEFPSITVPLHHHSFINKTPPLNCQICANAFKGYMYFLGQKTQCPQICIKLTQFEDNGSRKLP